MTLEPRCGFPVMKMTATRLRRAVVFGALAALWAWAAPTAGRVCLAAPATASETQAGLVIGPYVNSVTESSARIVWAGVGDRAAVTVKAAADTDGPEPQVAMETTAIGGRDREQLQVATVTGLRPGTTYAYQVAGSGQVIDGRFQTAPVAGSKGPLKFVTYGDPQTFPERHRQVIEAVLKELPFAFLAISGDLADDASKWNELKRDFFDPARDLLRQVALWTARGNHEKGARLYRDVFALPGNELYYSFDYGNLHYVILDPYQPDTAKDKSKAEMAEMIAWLDRDLAAAKTRADWLVVSYHEPTINVAGHGADWGREDVLPVLEKHGVDIVLCGHSHLYERIRPVGPKGGKPIIHITSGGGGGPTYEAAPSPILETSYAGLHYCLFTIEGHRLDLVAKTPDGKVIDRLTLIKADGRFQKEVMARALTIDEVGPLVKVFKVHRWTIDRLPEAGKALTGTIPGAEFPPGYQVTVETAPGSPWQVATLSFAASADPVALQVTPPEGVKLSATPWMGTFEPPLNVKISLVKDGAASSCDSVEVLLPAECLKQIVPAPPAVRVSAAPAGLVLDGRLDDWRTVAPLKLSTTGEPSKTLRLTWKADGLYGALQVRRPSLRPDDKKPWQGDSLELDFEMDRQRRLGTRREDTKAAMVFLSPLAGAAEGRPDVHVQSGALEAKKVEARWQKTADGYQMEFRVAAEALAPAKFAAGGQLGFNFIVRDGAGQEIEQFVDVRRLVSTWGRPVFWGRLEFAGP